MVTLRTCIGLTQQGLAHQLGISRRAVSDWELGNSYPKAEHLKPLIEIAISQQAFPTEQAEEMIRHLWQASHQKTLLDERWLSSALNHQRTLPASQPLREEDLHVQERLPEQIIHWSEAQATTSFYGREREIAQVRQWVLQDRCRFIGLLGIAGIGKSALAVQIMYQLTEHFDVVIFRSLRDTPSAEEFLNDCLQVLASQPASILPNCFEFRAQMFQEHLRTRRVLLVIDNLDSLFQAGDVRGHLRLGFEDYLRFLLPVAQTVHQSCLLMTSREVTSNVHTFGGRNSPVQTLHLGKLDQTSCEYLLREKGIRGSLQDQVRLIEAYAGNPHALKVVSETILDLFGGDIGQFLAENIVLFGAIIDLFAKQFSRLSLIEKKVLCWMTMVPESITIDELQETFIVPPSRTQLIEALDSLRRRSLIEIGRRRSSFTLPSIVHDYVASLLSEEAIREIRRNGNFGKLLE